MKSDLATSIAVAIVGVIVAYFVCNMFIGGIDDVSIKVLDSSTSVKVADPNIELFNYKALNPTVEVYIGDCSVTDEYGECLDDASNIDSDALKGNQQENSGNTNQEKESEQDYASEVE